MTSEEMSKVTLSSEWGEGKEEDFEDLHKAIKERKAGKNEYKAQNDWESSEEEEDEEEPSEDKPGLRLLWAAQKEERTPLLEELIEKDPSLVSFRDDDGYTALHRACYSANAGAAKRLLDAGADLTALTEDEWTPLHSACRWNAADCVELLLDRGADVNARTQGGQTPLHLAAFGKSTRETLQLLFLRAADRLDGEAKNCQQDTALDIARRNDNCVAYFELIRDACRRETL